MRTETKIEVGGTFLVGGPLDGLRFDEPGVLDRHGGTVLLGTGGDELHQYDRGEGDTYVYAPGTHRKGC